MPENTWLSVIICLAVVMLSREKYSILDYCGSLLFEFHIGVACDIQMLSSSCNAYVYGEGQYND